MEIIAICNRKGGDGKSATAQALAHGLTLKGYKTLLIDLDSQANTTDAVYNQPYKNGLLEILNGTANINDCIYKGNGTDIIPSNYFLTNTEKMEINLYALKNAINGIKAKYDFIILDTPPSLNNMIIFALASANSVIIPSQADMDSLKGIGLFYNIYKKFKYSEDGKNPINPNLTIKGILLTRYNARSIISKTITDLLNKTAIKMQTKVFNTTISESVIIKESKAVKKSIFEYAPKSKSANEYNALINEILNN